MMVEDLTFIKLGGSLITNKRQRETPRYGVLKRLAHELHEALDTNPQQQILLGHGSGSFGHWEANRYGTRQGVQTDEQWYGFARVSAAASRLNRVVVDTFLDADVPVLSLQPSSSALADEGNIHQFEAENIRRALRQHLIPLIFGDVAFDKILGGTILSTEDLFVHLAEIVHPMRILLFGNAPGVMDNERNVIPNITPETYPQVEQHLRGSRYTDVTGGMADKVKRMVDLVQKIPKLQVWILTGREPGNLRRALLHPETTPGTRIGCH
jgi:isopentenyl phosphate kinase